MQPGTSEKRPKGQTFRHHELPFHSLTLFSTESNLFALDGYKLTVVLSHLFPKQLRKQILTGLLSLGMYTLRISHRKYLILQEMINKKPLNNTPSLFNSTHTFSDIAAGTLYIYAHPWLNLFHRFQAFNCQLTKAFSQVQNYRIHFMHCLKSR